MKIPDKVYDVLKWVALTCIPAVTTFLGVVLGALKVDPNTMNIILTILPAVGTLIGALIGISTVKYNNGGDENV